MPTVNFNMVSSGSKGNCSLIWDDETLLVFDFGITLKRFRERLRYFHLEPSEYSMFISHEHSDHTKGIPILRKHDRFDLYSRDATLEVLRQRDGYAIHDTAAIGNFSVTAVSVLHDAADPVGYIVKSGKAMITIVSDLGKVSSDLINLSRNSDVLAFESNHDIEMLKTGRYPDMLKKRILSNHGHLSNEQSAEAISRVTGPGTRIVLTHLSQENNTADTALGTVKSYLGNREIAYRSIECASQATGSSHIQIPTD